MPKAAKATKYGMKRKNGKKKGSYGGGNQRSAAGYGDKSKQKQVYTDDNRKNPKSVNYSYPTDNTYDGY